MAIQYSILFEKKAALRRKQIIGYLAAFSIGVTLLSGIIDAFYNLYDANLARLIIVLLYLGVYFVNSKNEVYGGVLIYILSNVIIVFYAGIVGREPLIHLYLFSVLVGTPFVIDTRKTKTFIGLLILPLAGYFLLELFDFNFLNYRLPTANPGQVSKLNLVFNFLLLQLYVFQTIKIFQKNENVLIENEMQLRAQNIELVKLNRELDRFVYSVSHDLRAPISSVLGLIELSKEEHDIIQLKQYNKLKKDSLERLDTYINDILEFSRNARLEVSKDEINLKELIDELIKSLEYSENYNKIEIAIEVDYKEKFLSDQKRLAAVFNNLISNAIRYMDDTKENRYLKISAFVTKYNAEIIFEDNGVGIDEQYQEKVFNMFYRANSDTKGTGLGLYIVKETIGKMQGKITLSSKVNQGTTITLNIPNLLA